MYLELAQLDKAHSGGLASGGQSAHFSWQSGQSRTSVEVCAALPSAATRPKRKSENNVIQGSTSKVVLTHTLLPWQPVLRDWSEFFTHVPLLPSIVKK